MDNSSGDHCNVISSQTATDGKMELTKRRVNNDVKREADLDVLIVAIPAVDWLRCFASTIDVRFHVPPGSPAPSTIL